MVNYNEFKEEVVKVIKKVYPTANISCTLINKVNGTMEAFTINVPEEKLIPNVYTSKYYEEWMKGRSFAFIRKEIEKLITENAITSVPEVKNFLMKSNIIFELINADMNQDLCKTHPTRKFLDLLIVYRCIINCNENGDRQSFLITNKIMNDAGLTETDLYGYTFKNTKSISNPTVKDMMDIVAPYLSEEEKALMPSEEKMFVVSNECSIQGASSILYPVILESIANEMNSDLYILPSSIHEVICVSSDKNPRDLSEMVKDVNGSVVDKDEWLSDHAYFYDRRTKQISMC